MMSGPSLLGEHRDLDCTREDASLSIFLELTDAGPMEGGGGGELFECVFPPDSRSAE